MTQWEASDKFEKWLNAFDLGLGKKIMVVGQNYGFDKQFIQAWLGEEYYNSAFHHLVRDLLPASLYLNDVATFSGIDPPFPHHNLSRLAARLGVKMERGHNALEDCIATAECYRNMCLKPVFM